MEFRNRHESLTNEDASLSFDPLAGYEGIALFPQTFGCGLTPPDPEDLDAVHNHLKSMALRSPNKLQEQAKTILAGISEPFNSEVPDDILSQVTKDVDTNDNETQRDRRPGLGRKRARFSLKPNSSQPTVSLEPNLDINQLKDPEEFFMAYERHENAKREIQKQMGGAFIDKQNLSTKPRQRRPGILGPNKRTVKYKHFHSSVLPDGDEAPISSQENFEPDILSPTQSLHEETSCPNISSRSQELDGSISKTENRLDGLLDELLSTSCEDFDGDEGFMLLQEHLQIKPIVLDKLTLPDLQNIRRRNDQKAFDGESPKPRQVLVDMQNLLGGESCKLPAKNREETVVQNKGSPTLTRSPFASLLALKKRILRQSDPLVDQYSFSFDTSPVRNSSPVDRSLEQSDMNDKLKDPCSSSELNSLRSLDHDNIVAEPCFSKVTIGVSPDQNEDVITMAEPCIPMVNLGDSPDQSGKSGNIDLKEIPFSSYMGSKSVHVDPEGHVGGSGIDEAVLNENLSVLDANVDFQTDEVCAFQDNEMQVGDVPEAGVPPVKESNNSDVACLEQSHAAISEDRTVGGLPESVDIGVEQQQLEKNQELSSTSMKEPSKSKLRPRKGDKRKHPSQLESHDEGNMSCEQENLEASKGSLNEQAKAKKHIERKRKDSSKRQSLAGAGTKWDGGVRRSTRFRTRPLEYWKGERLLYGRIHSSMSTVIGMKYVSPGKGDRNPTVKVKQIVSDEYKELIDLAAWH